MSKARAAQFLVTVGIGGISALLRGTRAATSAITALVGAFGSLISVIGTLSAALGVVSGLFTAFILVNAQAIDSIGKISTVVGISTDLIQKFGFAAEQTGVAFNQSSVALRRFSRRLGEAQRGTGELLPALRRLGINTKNADGSFKDAEQVLFEFADALQATTGESARLSLAFKAFDSEGAELVATLQNGADGLKELFNEAERLGFVLNRSTIREVENFNDSFNVLVNIVKGAIRQFIGALAPALNTINNELADLVKSVTNGEESFKNLGEFLKNTFFNILIDVVTGLNNILPELEKFANKIIRIINGINFDPAAQSLVETVEALKSFEDIEDFDVLDSLLDSDMNAKQLEFGKFIATLKLLAQQLTDLGVESDQLQEILDLGAIKTYFASFSDEKVKNLVKAKDALIALAEPLLGINNLTGGKTIPLFDEEQSETLSKIVTFLERLRDATADSVEFVKEFKVATTETNRDLDLTLTRFERFVLDIKDVFTKTIPETFEQILQFIDNMVEKLRELGVGDAMKTLEDGFVKAAQMFEDALADAIVQGKLDFTKLGEHIRKVLAKALVQKFITGPILSIFGLADGGPAKAGTPYIVGEQGPELFVPNQSGTVIPNNQLQGRTGGMGGGTVINISAVDTQSFQSAIARDPEFIFNVTRMGARRTPTGG